VTVHRPALLAEFVTSAAGAKGIPHDPLPHVALVGRSNVGKSSLINALVGRTVARASAAPGKTRLINLYRVQLEGPRPARFSLVDLPGDGVARGALRQAQGGLSPSKAGSGQFAGIVEEYFGTSPASAKTSARQAMRLVILVLDARHPGLPQDLATLAWLDARSEPVVLVATKIDKLTRAERVHALRAFEDSCKRPVLPVSAATGEGLDALWKQIVKRLKP
jgi:GTP-binding protein